MMFDFPEKAEELFHLLLCQITLAFILPKDFLPYRGAIFHFQILDKLLQVMVVLIEVVGIQESSGGGVGRTLIHVALLFTQEFCKYQSGE
jgi:hypothetical protein